MKPWNIVFCHVDQLAQKALSAYGCQNVKTPNIDRLMESGVSFAESYSANPICCPARTSWYTGRMSSEHRVLINGDKMNPDFPDLGQWMQPRGYDCYYIGKWHIPRVLKKSFKVLYPEFHIGEKHDSSCARTAEAFFSNYKGDKPFFLNIGLLNPHDCCYLAITSDPLATKFGVENNFSELLPPRPVSLDESQPMSTAVTSGWSKRKIDLYRYYYFRMIERVDREIGRIFDALQHSDFSENTVFIFSSDHGEMMGAHNMIYKSQHYDESLKVPLVVVQPGVKGGRRDASHFVSGVDMAPAILDYAGMPDLPDFKFARSFRPLVENEDVEIDWRSCVVSEIFHGGARTVLVDKKYKCQIHHGNQKCNLYDRQADPDELNDIAEKPGSVDVIRGFRKKLDDYRSNDIEAWEKVVCGY